MCAAVSWASATTQVLNKFLDHPFVQGRDRSTFPANPMNQVLDRPNMPSSCYFGIARLT